MRKNVNIISLFICIVIPLAVGGLSGVITVGSMKDFAALNQPPLSPPGWLFPIVWTVLYIMMGIASYLVLETSMSHIDKKNAFKAYFLQLGFNFFWSIIFFTFSAYEIAFIWLLILLMLIVLTAVRFWKIDKIAGILMIPYIVWVSFAGYLNLAIGYMN